MHKSCTTPTGSDADVVRYTSIHTNDEDQRSLPPSFLTSPTPPPLSPFPDEAQTYSSQTEQQKQPWAGETRHNIIRLVPGPRDDDPIRVMAKYEIIEAARNLTTGPSIVADPGSEEGKILQLVFFCDGSMHVDPDNQHQQAGR